MKFGLVFSILLSAGVFAEEAPPKSIALVDTKIEKLRDSIYTTNFPGNVRLPEDGNRLTALEGESIKQRRISYIVKTCLLKSPSNEALSNAILRVTYTDNLPKQITNEAEELDVAYATRRYISDGRGCISWLAYLGGRFSEPIPPTVRHVKIEVEGTDMSTQLAFLIAPNGELAQFAVTGDLADEVFYELEHPDEATLTREQIEKSSHMWDHR